jgi:hypothetical protein
MRANMKPQISKRLDKLDSMLEALLADLQPLPDALLNSKPGPGKWSVLQVLHHLMIAEQLSAMYVQKKTSTGIDDIPEVPISSYTKLLSLRLTFLMPFKFKAPPAVGDDVLPDTSTLDEVFGTWRQNRQSLRALLHNLPENVLGKAIYKHPIAGKLNAAQMLDFFDLHFSHHLAQIKRTLNAVR